MPKLFHLLNFFFTSTIPYGTLQEPIRRDSRRMRAAVANEGAVGPSRNRTSADGGTRRSCRLFAVLKDSSIPHLRGIFCFPSCALTAPYPWLPPKHNASRRALINPTAPATSSPSLLPTPTSGTHPHPVTFPFFYFPLIFASPHPHVIRSPLSWRFKFHRLRSHSPLFHFLASSSITVSRASHRPLSTSTISP